MAQTLTTTTVPCPQCGQPVRVNYRKMRFGTDFTYEPTCGHLKKPGVRDAVQDQVLRLPREAWT